MRTTPQTGRHPVTVRIRPEIRARRAALFCAGVLAAVLALPAAAAGGLAGHWRINDAMTRAAQPEQKVSKSPSSGGFSGPMVVVGGMPIPAPGSTEVQPGLGGASPDPMVMRCSELTITPAGDTLALEFPGVGSDRLRRGDDQGVRSRWNERKLTTSYRTTTRKVSQTWELDGADHLLVTVKINPDNGRTQTHKRVFDRVVP